MQAQELYINTREQLRNWLNKNHTQKAGVWLVFDKGVDRKLDYEDIIEELLCFGWIDSTAGSADEKRTKLYVVPRKKSSYWSKPNKERIRKLEKAGLLAPAGIRMVAIAKDIGTWSAMYDVDRMVVPEDLLQELKKFPNAQQNFNAFSESVKKQHLAWIVMAKRPETRIKRIKKIAERAEANIKF